MRFKSNVSSSDLFDRYGAERVIQAKEDYLNDRHNTLCWFFIADYCKDNHCSPYLEGGYNYAKDLFYRLIEEI